MEEQDHMALASHRRSSTEGQGLQCPWSLFSELPTLDRCRQRAVSRPCCRLGAWVGFHSIRLLGAFSLAFPVGAPDGMCK